MIRKDVKVNGKRADIGTILHEGDVVKYIFLGSSPMPCGKRRKSTGSENSSGRL